MPPVATPEIATPQPQPGDLASPVPGVQGELDELFAQLPQTSTPVAAATPAPATPAEGLQETPPPAADAIAASQAAPKAPEEPPVKTAEVDDLFRELTAYQTQAKLQEAPNTEEGSGAPVYARLIANIGKEPDVQRTLLQKTLGPEYETKIDEDAVWFRKKGDQFFMRMDPKEWKGASEFLKDMTVDIAPDIAEGLVASAITAMAARAGAIVGGVAGGALGGAPTGGVGMAPGAIAGGVTGYIGGALAGLPLGGAAAAQMRSSVASAFGAPNEVDLKKEAAFNSLATLGAAGVSQAFRRPAAAILDRLADVIGNSPMGRVRSMAKIREGIENFSKEYGLPDVMKAPRPSAELGTKVASILDETEERLGKQVGIVKQKALSVAKNNPLPVNNFMTRAKGLLEAEGATFNEQNGFAQIPAEIDKLKPFGEASGQTMRRLVQDYNAALRNGGMPLNQMFNSLDFYKAEGGYQKNLPDAANTVYQRLRGALRQDRDAALVQVLPEGSEERAFAQKAFGEFKENIDEIRKFQRLANKSPEKFAEAMISPKESQRVVQLKQVLGEDSQAFSNVKAAWYANLIQKAVDPDTGLVVGGVLKRELDKYGPDVVNQLMSKEQQNVLRALATRAEKLPVLNMVDNPASSAFFKDLIRANLNGVSSAESKFRVLWSMFGQNKKAMQYLTNEGLLDLAKETRDPMGKTATLKALEWAKKVMQVSEIKTSPKGVELIKPPIDVGVLSGIINATEQAVDEDLPDYMQRRKSTLNALRRENGLMPLEENATAEAAAQ